MKPSVPLQALFIALTTLSAGTLVAASEERPRLESYPSSYEFLQALQVWNKVHPDGAATSTGKPAGPVTPTMANIDPTSELAPPPIEITGPENLDHAVEQAKSISHPAYKEKVRYHRSTHISFPLPSIDGQDMSQASIGEALDMKSTTSGGENHVRGDISTLLDQDQRKLQGSTQEIGSTAGITTAPITINESMLSSGPRGHVDISVSGH